MRRIRNFIQGGGGGGGPGPTAGKQSGQRPLDPHMPEDVRQEGPKIS